MACSLQGIARNTLGKNIADTIRLHACTAWFVSKAVHSIQHAQVREVKQQATEACNSYTEAAWPQSILLLKQSDVILYAPEGPFRSSY